MDSLTLVHRYWHTARHLRPTQFAGRMRHKLQKFHSVSVSTALPRVREPVHAFLPPIAVAPTMTGPTSFIFLNEAGVLSGKPSWNDMSRAKLWLYNLHYFDDLTAIDAVRRGNWHHKLITRWIAENPPGHGNGWEPYPTSLRIVNWTKWALAGNNLTQDQMRSLATQARWLMRHIEWHLLGNHLLANAKALIFAGLYFVGDETDRWLRRGLSIYRRELPEQVLEDGGHFELSPMYQAIILEDLLDILNLARCYGMADREIFADLAGIIASMRAWLEAMTHPDGGLSFFNDSALGIAATREELEAYAARLKLPSGSPIGQGAHHLSSSGYVRVNHRNAVAILDLAPVGPDYIPGHAHADTLSFELSLDGSRVIVNGGTSVYAPGVLRDAQRATKAHSTVEIDGENSSEVWASFRVARRARPWDTRINQTEEKIEVEGAHDGYRRLAGKPLHRRKWTFEGDGLTVVDEVLSRSRKPAVARFHLGPGVLAEAGPDGRKGKLHLCNGQSIAWQTTASARVKNANWHPEFGKSIPTQSLEVPFQSNELMTVFRWS